MAVWCQVRLQLLSSLDDDGCAATRGGGWVHPLKGGGDAGGSAVHALVWTGDDPPCAHPAVGGAQRHLDMVRGHRGALWPAGDSSQRDTPPSALWSHTRILLVPSEEHLNRCFAQGLSQGPAPGGARFQVARGESVPRRVPWQARRPRNLGWRQGGSVDGSGTGPCSRRDAAPTGCTRWTYLVPPVGVAICTAGGARDQGRVCFHQGVDYG